MSVKKVAIIEPVGGHGGMDLYDYGLAIGLANKNIHVTLYTCNSTIPQTHENLRTVYSFGDLWTHGKLLRLFVFLNGYLKAFRDVKKNKITHVHFHFFLIRKINIGALLLAKLFPFKTILTIHDVDPLVNHAPKLLHKWTYKLVDEIIVHNNFSKSELIKKSVTSKPINVIPHGNYYPYVKSLPYKPYNGTLQLLFFGQIKEEKGLNILLNSLAKLVKRGIPIHLTIAGRPWRMKESLITDEIERLGLSNHTKINLNYVENKELEKYFGEADLIVLPYKRIYQSGVLLMTMSFGKPVLTSDLPPMKEIIRDGENGFTFKSESVDALSEKLMYISNHPTLLESIIVKSNATIKDLGWDNIATQLIEVYK